MNHMSQSLLHQGGAVTTWKTCNLTALIFMSLNPFFIREAL